MRQFLSLILAERYSGLLDPTFYTTQVTMVAMLSSLASLLLRPRCALLETFMELGEDSARAELT